MKKKLLISELMDERCIDGLTVLGYEVIKLPSFGRLPAALSSHPDMLIYMLRTGEMLLHRDYYDIAERQLAAAGRETVLTDEPVGEVYPSDILFNALALGDTVFGRLDCISKIILEDSPRAVYVRQGYTRCSSCVIPGAAGLTGDARGLVITADRGIAAAVAAAGAEAVPITGGHIALAGYDCGFIGGASVLLDRNTLAFFGDIMTHPDGDRITAVLKNRGVCVLSLKKGILSDYGGTIVI